ncbi:hypothetical protein JQ609_12725 [Bradyrhizobium sp. AUGA SZCCT0169]|uniref:hypothetical protein n=1 Tax=unclassified Bradyrhizobium TaxID=2631580 RepID=UPI001BAA430E|nr:MULTISPECIES: hypothetical protein [unclassified Bradyrhizobium]MBR1191566.1 hypothetical protein [Bradyrhizobium sp. AUGA SZCCT0160]MBR1247798.1 hypothetical protein [Bradyrhizobium sp. AUGA SZCCT0169]
MAIGKAITLMCRARKSREGDHFAATIGLRLLFEGFTSVINKTAPASSRPKHFYIEREYVQFG